MKKIIEEDHRITVRLKSAGDYGVFSISGVPRDEQVTRSLLEEVRHQILRHCDNVTRHSVDIDFDSVPVCEFCGSRWTEDGDTYNGGCCHKDEVAEETRVNGAAE